MRRLSSVLLVLTCLGITLSPKAAFAQAQGSVTGAVKDASGAVLPGVTVEVASPALIERTRSVVTDGSGQYRFTNLFPGSYTVTFTATDRAGRRALTSFSRWASGTDWVPWNDESQFKMDVIPDKSRYSVGDTATVDIHPLHNGQPGGGLVRAVVNGTTLNTRASTPE